MQDIKEYIALQCRSEFLKDSKKYCSQLKIKESTAELFEIGIVPEEGLISMLESAGYSKTEIENLNLSDLKNRFCFPSHTSDGRISAFYFRWSNTSLLQPKWINQNYIESDLYGIDKCTPDKKYILLCEGVSDTLACAKAGISNAISKGNFHFPNDEQTKILKQFGTVVLAFVNDDCGKKFSEKAKRRLVENGINTFTLEYEGRDICEALRDLTQRRLIINQLKTIMSK